jgi:hypothetical protein
MPLLFIVIGILKTNIIIFLGSFYIFYKSRQTISGFVTVPLYAHPLPPLFIVIEILKLNIIIIGFFYY